MYVCLPLTWHYNGRPINTGLYLSLCNALKTSSSSSHLLLFNLIPSLLFITNPSSFLHHKRFLLRHPMTANCGFSMHWMNEHWTAQQSLWRDMLLLRKKPCFIHIAFPSALCKTRSTQVGKTRKHWNICCCSSLFHYSFSFPQQQWIYQLLTTSSRRGLPSEFGAIAAAVVEVQSTWHPLSSYYCALWPNFSAAASEVVVCCSFLIQLTPNFCCCCCWLEHYSLVGKKIRNKKEKGKREEQQKKTWHIISAKKK